MIPQEEECPVSETLLGQLYRADPNGLPTLVNTIPPAMRALLAIYCFRRSHLQSIALAIASSCDKDELVHFGGKMGEVIFEQAQRAPIPIKQSKITLSTETLRHVIAQDLI